MNVKIEPKSTIKFVKLPITEEALQLLKTSDESLKDLTKVTNTAGWYINKNNL